MAEVQEVSRPRTDAGKSQGPSTELESRSTATLPSLAHPMALANRLAEEMDRVFEDFGLRLPGLLGRGRELFRREVGIIPAEWSPRVDVLRDNGTLLIRADLPGMTKDDIQVEITEDRLTLKGERKQETKATREGMSYNECSYGSFYRAIPLPEGIDAAKATAEFRNGVLEVTMPAPQRQDTKVRRVEIQEKN